MMKLRKLIFSTAALVAAVVVSAGSQAATRIGYVDTDMLFERRQPKAISASRDTTLKLWRGERASVAAMFASSKPTGRLKLTVEPTDGSDVAQWLTPLFVDYVATNDWKACGWPADTMAVYEVADALLSQVSPELAAGTRRPIWLTADIPAAARPGSYAAKVVVEDIYKNRRVDSLMLTIDVAERLLPAPKEWRFNLDMWQQPYAVSRYYGVENWSDDHFKHLEPYAEMLARAGQKAVSAILFYEPWGEQSNDKFEPMVETILGADGNWRYDYTVFDRWVEFNGRHGIDSEIECFSMLPWDMTYRYFDEAKGDYATVTAKPDSPEYENLWGPFLKSFAQHLKKKGWFDRTVIAIDERSLPDMLAAKGVAQKYAPGIKMALHGNFHPELADDLDSYTLLVGDLFPAEVLERRNAAGKVSRYYTCCANAEPNIFSNSHPADAAYIPVYCNANNVSGYLHWAFTNWTDNPLTDTRFYMFAPGDTYCVYPDGGSSVRWERMIEGLELSEKIDILRGEFEAASDNEALARLDELLAPLRGTPAALADRLRHYGSLRDFVAEY